MQKDNLFSCGAGASFCRGVTGALGEWAIANPDFVRTEGATRPITLAHPALDSSLRTFSVKNSRGLYKIKFVKFTANK